MDYRPVPRGSALGVPRGNFMRPDHSSDRDARLGRGRRTY
jgi:hypothetical protein